MSNIKNILTKIPIAIGSKLKIRNDLLLKNFFLIAICGLNIFCSAQTFLDSALVQNKFIKAGLNEIGNDTASLDYFFQKLYNLQHERNGKLTIVHIGDSHIQADYFSGLMRQKFLETFGNGGRGLIVPCKIARTNEAPGYRTTSNVLWESKRNVMPDLPLPVGIGGVTIRTVDPTAVIRLDVFDYPPLGYAFNKISLFTEKGKDYFHFEITDTTGKIIGREIKEKIDRPFITTFKLDTFYSAVLIRQVASDTISQSTIMYGMLVENDSAGIEYNTIGVNGAEYKHYNQSQYFVRQLSETNPDLVIISLGTNDSYMKLFDKNVFENEMSTLVNAIRKNNPGANILLTTPGDSYRRKRYKNPNIATAGTVMKNFCMKNNIAYWDLYKIMGGMGSMGKWFAHGLSQRDKLHMNKNGYRIQGELLFDAIMKSYQQFVNVRYQ